MASIVSVASSEASISNLQVQQETHSQRHTDDDEHAIWQAEKAESPSAAAQAPQYDSKAPVSPAKDRSPSATEPSPPVHSHPYIPPPSNSQPPIAPSLGEIEQNFTELQVQRSISQLNIAEPGLPTRHFLDGRSKLFEILFIVTAAAGQYIAQAQFGMVVIPLTEIGRYLGTTDPGELTWMTASYGLSVGMFLIVSGRLGDLFGPKLLYSIGLGVIVVANVASGFCKTRIPFDICRALAGLGAALSVPNGVAILGRTYPPGRMRSIVYAMLGAIGPIGFISGGSLAALLAVKVSVPWIWWFTAIFSAVVLGLAILTLPPDDTQTTLTQVKAFDYLGTLLLISALGLFNFTWNQAPITGWPESYVWSLLIVAVAAFAAFYFWERSIGKEALIPTEVLQKTSLLVYLCLWLGWMSFGVFLFYTSLLWYPKYQELALYRSDSRSPDESTYPGWQVASSVIPACSLTHSLGIIAALAVPTLITRFPGHQIFLVSMVAFLIGDIMASVAPAHSGYWSVTMPSMILVIADLSFATGQLIVSNSVDRQYQGIAGGIVSMLTNYSLSIGLGMAGTVERYVKKGDGTVLQGYRSAFYFGTGLALLAVAVVGLFVRMPKQAQYRE